MANKQDTCECENASHFSIRDDKTTPKHIYGHMFPDYFMETVKTPYGTFRVCRNCRDVCHQHIKG